MIVHVSQLMQVAVTFEHADFSHQFFPFSWLLINVNFCDTSEQRITYECQRLSSFLPYTSKVKNVVCFNFFLLLLHRPSFPLQTGCRSFNLIFSIVLDTTYCPDSPPVALATSCRCRQQPLCTQLMSSKVEQAVNGESISGVYPETPPYNTRTALTSLLIKTF